MCVRDQFARFLETEDVRTDPHEWPHDQRSMPLRTMREADPARVTELAEQLRQAD